MRCLLFALILLVCPPPSLADLVATNGPNELRLMPGPCVHGGTLGLLAEEWRPKFHKAQADIGGKIVFACWIDTDEGYYFVMFENGIGMAYPITSFTDQPGV